MVVDTERQRAEVVPHFKHWDVHPLAPREHFRAFPDVHPLVIQLLWGRGIQQAADVAAFLAPSEVPMASPWEMLGVLEAVERLLLARQRGETVVVYGDYDADGITSTALLRECLTELGVTVLSFIPRRDREGYGLNELALDRLREQGAQVILAVDCGITAVAEVSHAAALGLDVIVADHHHVPENLPGAVAVVNPQQPGCSYPFKDLCAVGIAYQLATALGERTSQSPGWADRWLDLVAIGTVADVVPLRGENRSLVARGLKLLNPPKRPGLRALAVVAGVPDNRLTSQSIAFILAPRLNAAGRLADADVSLRLLLTRSATDARELASELDGANRQRQEKTQEMLGLARRDLIGPTAAHPLPKLLMITDASFHQGIVGLVAGKLVEEFHRPVLVAENVDGVVRGSARSIDGFHIADALARCGEHLLRHGGHALAAGFTLEATRLDQLREKLQTIAAAEISDDACEPRLAIDAEIALRKHDGDLYAQLGQLEPFGCENTRPVFVSRAVRVLERRVVGSNPPGHLKLTLLDGDRRWDAMGFGMGDRLPSHVDRIDLVFQLERHEYDGQTSIRLRLLDLGPATARP
jgi:single-stranded-DNA-specific exonuclease